MTFIGFLKNILQLSLSPSNGWKDIESQGVPVDTLTSRGLYPLMAIMLLSVFIQPLYGFESFDLVNLLQIALIQFIALYIALYSGKNLIQHYLPEYNETGESDPMAASTVAVYGTALMTVIQIVENLLPFELTVIKLLPVLAAICLWKSDRYLDINKSKEFPFMIIILTSLILPVILINLLMSIIVD